MAAAGLSDESQVNDVEDEIVPIKRYPNRRFYDRKSRKYVTLHDIEELVQQGLTIDVRDSKNHEDLTRVVLTQILLERHPERMEMFPVPLLHTILRANDLVLEFLRLFMRLSLTTLENFQRSGTLTPFVSPLDWMRMIYPGLPPGPGPQTQLNPPADPNVERLINRVAELEDRIRQLESSTPESPTTASAPELEMAQEATGKPHRRPDVRSSK